MRSKSKRAIKLGSLASFAALCACASAGHSPSSGDPVDPSGNSSGAERAGGVTTPEVVTGAYPEVALLASLYDPTADGGTTSDAGLSADSGAQVDGGTVGKVVGECTGTLVRTQAVDVSNVIVTAAHCAISDIKVAYFGSPKKQPSNVNTNFEAAVQGLVAVSVIKSKLIAPNALFSSYENECPHNDPDMMLLELDKKISGIVPATMVDFDPTSDDAGSTSDDAGTVLGQKFRYVGFGQHAEDIRYEGTDVILPFVADKHSQPIPLTTAFSSETSTAQRRSNLYQSDVSAGVPGPGDSGGPLFIDGTHNLVGTVSCGHGSSVRSGGISASLYERDQYYAKPKEAWQTIEETMRAWDAEAANTAPLVITISGSN